MQKSKTFFPELQTTNHPLISMPFIILESDHVLNIARIYGRKQPHKKKLILIETAIWIINDSVLTAKLQSYTFSSYILCLLMSDYEILKTTLY